MVEKVGNRLDNGTALNCDCSGAFHTEEFITQVWQATLPDITAPSLTTNLLYANGGRLYWAGSVIAGAATGNWASDGTNVWRATGDVGIGTTSPSATLAVNGTGFFSGDLTASGSLAISSNATSTFTGPW